MPIQIRDFVWSQTEKEVQVTLPLNKVNPKYINDILITDKFVKVNYRPYYFEVFLEHSIDKEASKCKILENNIKFILKKTTENENWNNLESAEANQKSGSEKTDLKVSILNDYSNEMATDYENRAKMKAESKRKLIDMEIKESERVRGEIDAFYERVKQQEVKEVRQVKDKKKNCLIEL